MSQISAVPGGMHLQSKAADPHDDEEESFWDASESDETTNTTEELSYDLSAGGDYGANHSQRPKADLNVIQGRIIRIVGRVSYLSQSLKQLHRELKERRALYEQSSSYSPSCVNSSTAFEFPRPSPSSELNLQVERIGDSVACQTFDPDEQMSR
ncbi:hypothetical protein KR222_006157 [Zaprionus bogoriensis]|nr:hypothetical protein KR222_006157 [Zaprionus bogoriensis]